MISLLHAYMHVQKYTLKLHNERNLVLCCNAEGVYNMLSSLIWHKRITTLSLKKKIFLPYSMPKYYEFIQYIKGSIKGYQKFT